MPIEKNEPVGILEYLRWLEKYRSYKKYDPVIALDEDDYKKMFPEYYSLPGK